MKLENFFLWVCKKIGKPFSSTASQELKDAADFLKWDINPELIIGAGKFFMFFVGFLVLLGIGLSVYFKFEATILLVLFPFSIIAFYGFTEWPKIYAQERAVDALGQAPQIISQVAVTLKESPSLENAMAFVANNSEGEIAKDFKSAIWKLWSGKKASAISVLEEIGWKWGKWSSGFQRAVFLISSTFHEKNPVRRNFTLDKSISVMLDDIVSQMKDYTLGMHMPTLILFTIGIVVPLMIISLLPVLSIFGISFSAWTIVAFLTLSVAAVALYSEIVLRKRPPSVSFYEIKQEVPEGYFKIAGHYVLSWQIAIIVGVFVSFPGLLYVFQSFGVVLGEPMLWVVGKLTTLPIVWGIGFGLAIYFLGESYYKKKQREKLIKLEDQFLDSLYHIKNRLSDGRPVEDALEFSQKMSRGPEISEFLGRLLAKLKRRSLPLEKIVEEEEMESRMVKSVFRVMTSSLKMGTSAAGQSVEVMLKYLEKIRKVNKQLTSLLSKNLSMMKATAIFFAPLVCAVIIVLFQLISHSIAASQGKAVAVGYAGAETGAILAPPEISPSILQLIVGLYALALNFVLVRYVSRINYGGDSTALNSELATSFVAIVIIFTSALIIGRATLVGAV